MSVFNGSISTTRSDNTVPYLSAFTIAEVLCFIMSM
jgi:hypothetical protein